MRIVYMIFSLENVTSFKFVQINTYLIWFINNSLKMKSIVIKHVFFFSSFLETLHTYKIV